MTPQAYRRIVEEALTAAGRAEKDSQVYDLFAIPDYIKFLTPMLGKLEDILYRRSRPNILHCCWLCLDKKFSRYCKMNYTQHQFSFEKADEGVCQVEYGIKMIIFLWLSFIFMIIVLGVRQVPTRSKGAVQKICAR